MASSMFAEEASCAFGESFGDKDAAVNAQAQANQRIATPQGWKRMNEWLKTADKAKNLKKLKDLLSQCIESNITTELLLSNDTPRFILQLSKTSKDKEISEKANHLVSKWKKVVKSADPNLISKRDEKAILKTSENSTTATRSSSAASNTDKKSPPQVVHSQTEVGILDKLKQEMSADPLAKKPAVQRPKTAKAKVSKPRSTGTDDRESLLFRCTIKHHHQQPPLCSIIMCY